MLGLVVAFSRQRLLFASLASSAFPILAPQHGTNSVRTLVVSQMMVATLGLITFLIFGGGYLSGGSAIVATIIGMVLLDPVHSPAVATVK